MPAPDATIRSKTAELQSLRADLDKPFARGLLLWQKSKDDVVNEMDSTIQVPGWSNIFTQPIINRIDMLATGVRTMIGVKVFGNDLDQIQAVSQEVAEVLRDVPGAVAVVPDQTLGKGYLEITIDREKAARYGVNVGDVQDVIEVALGGKPITEKRRRSRAVSRSAFAMPATPAPTKSDQEAADQRRAAAAMAAVLRGDGPRRNGRRQRKPPAAPARPLQIPAGQRGRRADRRRSVGDQERKRDASLLRASSTSTLPISSALSSRPSG